MNEYPQNISLQLVDPFVKTYSKNAALTSILGIHYISKRWMIDKYSVPLYIRYLNKTFGWYELRKCDSSNIWINEWEICPFIESRRFCTSSIPPYDLVNYAIEKLCEGFYIYLDLNTENISKYKKKKGIHDLLISGYDLKNKYFFCSDYFDQYYNLEKIPFEEISYSFETKRVVENRKDYNFLWKYKCADVNWIKESKGIEKFLTDIICPKEIVGIDPLTNSKTFFYSGISTYRYIQEDLSKGVLSYGDVRIFSVIQEHIKILIEFLDLFSFTNREIIDDLHNIAELLLIYSLKYSLSKNKKNIEEKICVLLQKLYEIEKKYIWKILKKLDIYENV